MAARLLDRVVSDRLERYKKIFNLIAAITAVAGILVTAILIWVPFIKPPSFWYDYGILLLMPLLYSGAIRIIIKSRKNHFIEWWTDRIVYKTTGDLNIQTILIDNIEAIMLKDDAVLITKKAGETATIDLSEFNNENIRIRVEQNFQQSAFYRGEAGEDDQLSKVTI
jgi:hypothetical protein